MTFPGALTISRLSTEYVMVAVNAVFNGSIYNPTSDSVQFAFTTSYGSVPAVWVAGSWDSNIVQGSYYNAKCLVGPGVGGTALAAGMYTIWLKITDNPEIPVRQAGTLIIQ